jgi:hypothetical protein
MDDTIDLLGSRHGTEIRLVSLGASRLFGCAGLRLLAAERVGLAVLFAAGFVQALAEFVVLLFDLGQASLQALVIPPKGLDFLGQPGDAVAQVQNRTVPFLTALTGGTTGKHGNSPAPLRRSRLVSEVRFFDLHLHHRGAGGSGVPVVASAAASPGTLDLSSADDAPSTMSGGAGGDATAADDSSSPGSVELATSSGPSATATSASLATTSGGAPAGPAGLAQGSVAPAASAGRPTAAVRAAAEEGAASGPAAPTVADPRSASWPAETASVARVHAATLEARGVATDDRPPAATPADESGEAAAEEGEGATASEAPAHADLATSFLPFDRASVERAIDEFLDHFDRLGNGLTDLGVAAHLAPGVVSLAAAALVSHVALKRRGRGDDWRTGGDAEAPLQKLSSLSVLWGCGE